MREQRARTVARRRDPWNSPPIASATRPPRAAVNCTLGFEVDERATLAFHIAAASTAGDLVHEELTVTLDGSPIAVEELPVMAGGRVHLVSCGAGSLDVSYRAELDPTRPGPQPVTLVEAIESLRQSRYCPSDELEGFAAAQFGGRSDDPRRPHAIADWVFERIRYAPGSSGPLDTAVDTLLRGEGVCRDFAHLTVALCRATGVPARLVSVYAPGLSPMDFHAVAEVAVDGTWEIVDATRLAPRSTLVRIATGRDAADTAFCTTLDGSAELVSAGIGASTDDDLPDDDHRASVRMP